MRKFYVNIKKEMIYAETVWAESKDMAEYKVIRNAALKGVENWNSGKLKVYSEKENTK